MRRGIFFSLDAILAMLVAFALSAAIFTSINLLLANKEAQTNLFQTTQDSLSVMEKTGVLQQAVLQQSSTPIALFASSLPQNLCHRISITSAKTNTTIIADENCGCNTFSVSRRSFIIPSTSADIYMAEMRACYK